MRLSVFVSNYTVIKNSNTRSIYHYIYLELHLLNTQNKRQEMLLSPKTSCFNTLDFLTIFRNQTHDHAIFSTHFLQVSFIYIYNLSSIIMSTTKKLDTTTLMQIERSCCYTTLVLPVLLSSSISGVIIKGSSILFSSGTFALSP